MIPKDADGIANRVYNVCPDLSVQQLRIITVAHSCDTDTRLNNTFITVLLFFFFFFFSLFDFILDQEVVDQGMQSATTFLYIPEPHFKNFISN